MTATRATATRLHEAGVALDPTLVREGDFMPPTVHLVPTAWPVPSDVSSNSTVSAQSRNHDSNTICEV